MDVITSPLITVILNLVASVLVSKGILDSHSSVAFVQEGNNLIAGLTTTVVALYTLYKSFDLAKHKVTLAHQAPVATKTETVVQISQPVSQETPVTPIGQMGTPESTTTIPNPANPAV